MTPHEDIGQPTSLDAAFFDDTGAPRLLVECKLVEREFGSCSVFAGGDCPGRNPLGALDQCYLYHIGRTYWRRMAEHGIAEALSGQAVCPFTSCYQFFRELLFALEKGATFAVLSDRRSAVFEGPGGWGLVPFMKSLLPPDLRNRVVSLCIQDLVTVIEASGRHADWIQDFREKYGLQEQQK